MKNLWSALLVTLCACFISVFAGCTVSQDGAGDVGSATFQIRIGAGQQAPQRAGKLLAAGGSSQIASGLISISKGAMNLSSSFNVVNGAASVSFGSIQVGNWSVYVALYDTNGFKIYEGNGSVSVSKNQSASLTVNVSQITGSVTIGITVPGLQLALSANFADSNSLSGWTETRRYWRISNGCYILDGGYVTGFSGARDGYSVYHMGDSAMVNYTMEADVMGLTNFMGGYMNPIILFRVNSWPGNNLVAPYNAYRLDIVPADSVSSQNQWTLSKYTNSSQGVILANGTSSLFVREWNHVEIAVNGGQITISVNGSVLTTYNDPAPITSGGIGLGSIWETGSAFDNVQIWE